MERSRPVANGVELHDRGALDLVRGKGESARLRRQTVDVAFHSTAVDVLEVFGVNGAVGRRPSPRQHRPRRRLASILPNKTRFVPGP